MNLQWRFLRTMRDEPAPLAQLLKKVSVEPPQLNRWLGRPRFQRALSASLKTLRRKRRLELELLRFLALQKVAGFLGEETPDTVVRKLCLALVQPPRRMARAVKSPPAPPMVHPDVDAAEAQALIGQIGKGGTDGN